MCLKHTFAMHCKERKLKEKQFGELQDKIKKKEIEVHKSRNKKKKMVFKNITRAVK